MTAGAGDTFLLTRGTGEVPHLWVILWGPAGGAQAFLAVYLTTLRAHSDRSCILVRDEHPFIQHDTAVAYGAVQRWTADKLDELAANGIARPRQPVTAAVLKRLREGFLPRRERRTRSARWPWTRSAPWIRPPGRDSRSAERMELRETTV